MSNATEANKERSRRLYVEVFGNGNYGAADELMAVDQAASCAPPHRVPGPADHAERPIRPRRPGCQPVDWQRNSCRPPEPAKRASGRHGEQHRLRRNQDRPPRRGPHCRVVVDPRPVHALAAARPPAWAASGMKVTSQVMVDTGDHPSSQSGTGASTGVTDVRGPGAGRWPWSRSAASCAPPRMQPLQGTAALYATTGPQPSR